MGVGLVQVLFRLVRDDGSPAFDEALRRSDRHVDRVTAAADLREAVASSGERRPPRFAPLGAFPN